MKLTLDTKANSLSQTAEDGSVRDLPLFSREAYELISEQWMRLGWGLGSWHAYTWYGRPILGFPEDLMRMQEVIFRLQPDYVVETGVKHGGSLVFYASLFEAMGKGRIIGVDIEILPEDLQALREHHLSHRIDVLVGSSVDPAIVSEVKRRVPADAKVVLVVLDSDHCKAHVAAELEAYHDIVTTGSYIVATDGIISLMHDVPGIGRPEWATDNATEAAKDFLDEHSDFILETPAWPFNKSQGLKQTLTYWPGAWLKHVPDQVPELFTVVIPTLDRYETLGHTLETCVTQKDANFRILVSDNHSTDATREIVEEYRRRDPRVEFIQPPKRLGMTAHWEFVLGQVKKGFVMLLGSDDGLLPDSVSRARACLRRHPTARALQGNLNAVYYYPNFFVENLAGKLSISATPLEEVRQARAVLEKVASSTITASELPSPYHLAWVQAAVLHEVAAKGGGMIRSHTPDVYLGIAVACVLEDFVSVSPPFSVYGVSVKSTGGSQCHAEGKAEIESTFQKEDEIPFHPKVGYSFHRHPHRRSPASGEGGRPAAGLHSHRVGKDDRAGLCRIQLGFMDR